MSRSVRSTPVASSGIAAAGSFFTDSVDGFE
jgi:hypothetical protein